jgi:tetratricopeptide (TPR) repeat protein
VDAGYSTGFGRRTNKDYIAPFASFKIGDAEEIKNARLRISDIDLQIGDMLIGADFFLSHRVFVANSQHKMYFTYNGGPVFDLRNSSAATTTAEPKAEVAELPDAAAYARRGEASAERHDYGQAIADLTRACELDSNEPEYLYQRGMAYWRNKQPEPALADFDHALALKPNFVTVLISRAEMRLGTKDIPGAIADLDSAALSAPKQADSRFTLGGLFVRVDKPQSAIEQYDLWIASHPDDAKIVSALNSSCWARAMQGTELDKALDDCNKAISHVDKKIAASYSALLDSRGFVRLRRGEVDKAIADFDDAVKQNPKNASSLYGRGIAKLRKMKTAEGQADIAAATALSPKISGYFERHGIAP